MTDGKLETTKFQTFPDHWSLFLHCTICFGFFQNPHTLECGHSFCKRCLKRVAEIAKEENPEVQLRRLVLTCPTCRHPFPAKPVLLGRLHTCIVLKHLVELWKRECKILLLSRPQYMRSICSQTEPERSEGSDAAGEGMQLDLQEEFSVRSPPGDEYFEAVMRRVTESSDEIEQDQLVEDTVFKISLLQGSPESERREHNSSSSDSSVSFSGDDIGGSGMRRVHGEGSATTATGVAGPLNNGASVTDLFGRISLSGIFNSTDSSPARILIIGVWFIYSLLIVALAEAFLPYVLLFTLTFFLLILK